jgi:hypothetical protein
MAKRIQEFNVKLSVRASRWLGRGPSARECFAPIMLKDDARLKVRVETQFEIAAADFG